MKKPVKKTDSATAQTMRQRAEEIARETADQSPENIDNQTPAEIRQTLHELRVHQIELDMQNEEMRRAQVELEEGRTRYFDLYDLAPVGYVTVSDKGLILEANITTASMLGVPRGALIKQPITRHILKDDQDIYYRHRKKLFETGEPQVCEFRMLRTGAASFWARLEATVAQDKDGGAPICRIALSDITEHKRLEEEKANLEVQTLQLQKAESLGCMANATVHHFNNLLQAIIGNMQLAIRMLPQNADQVKYMTAAMDAARTAQEISRKTMIYLGENSGNLEPLNLGDTCCLFLPTLQADIPKNVFLKTELPTHGPTIAANASQIQQMLTNMITNAWEAIGDSHGVISLRVKNVSAEDIPTIYRPTDWRKQDSAYVCLEVSDTGSGIAPNDIQKLFDPFFSSKFIGRGLGLSVVLGIVKGHHGAIAVASEPGKGSTFRVFLPAFAENIVA